MSNKFLYPVAFECADNEQKLMLAKELETLGYTPFDCGNSFELVLATQSPNYKNSEHFTSFYADGGLSSSRFHLCQSEQEFLALAAQRPGDEIFAGEWCKYSGSSDIEAVRGLAGLSVSKSWRKATKEEIIAHFRKNKESALNGVCCQNSNSKEPFTVEGSRYLLYAFLKEVEKYEDGHFSYSLSSAAGDINSREWEDGSIYFDNSCNGFGTHKCLKRHFVLPSQWAEAKQAFIDFYKEDKPAEVKVKLRGGEEVLIKKGLVWYKDYTLAISGVQEVSDKLKPINSGWMKAIFIVNINPECKDGICDITYSDTQLILDTHAKYFGK